MARLPDVGGDDGVWGGILNEFLEVEHNPDGTLKNTGTLSAYALLASPTFTGTVTVPSPVSATDAVTKQYVDNLVSTSLGDVTQNTDTDISANAWVVDEDNMVSNSNTKVPTQQSVKAYVDNLDSNNVKLTGDQTVAGVKTFTSLVRGDYGADGKFTIGGVSGAGGFFGLYGDASESDTSPKISLDSESGVRFGTGLATPDIGLARAAADRLVINNSEATLGANLSPTVNLQVGTTYTLVTSDAGKQILRSNSATSTQTLPQDSDAAIPLGTQIKFTNLGAGTVTFQAGTGASIVGGVTASLPPGTSAYATKLLANTWYVDRNAGPDNYSLSHEHSVGFYGSRIGMNKWRMSTRSLKHIVCWGDSVTQGGGVDAKSRSYVDGLRQILTNEMNEQVHEGMQPMYWAAAGGTSWRYTTSGGWASVTGQNASNLSPLGLNGTLLRSTNNTLRTITWTRPSHVRCTRFIIYWVDDATVTSGAKWSYSVNGGSTWTEVSTTSPGSPTLKTTEVTGVNDPADIRIRNADTAGTTWANSPAFMGIDIRHGEYGWVVHNYGGAGASLSLPINANSCGAVSTDRAGDWKPWFNLIQPELVVIEFSNDTAGYDQATFETAIQTACSHLNTTADLVAYGFMHQDRISGGGSLDAVRTHTRDKVLQYNGIALDMNARWTNMATAKTNGFMNPAHIFAIHPTELGDNDVASALGRLLRSYG